jgi:hypothetical protein
MATITDERAAHPLAAGPPQLVSALLHNSQLNQQFRKLKQALEQPVTYERRAFARIPLPLLLRITPLDETGQRLDHAAMTVVGKDISPRGLSFFHDRPMPHRRVEVTFDHPELGRFTMQVDVGWCQFTGSGWYVSGGRMLRTARGKPAAKA